LKQKTILVIALTVFLLIVWDIYAILIGGKESSISSVMVVYSYDYPIIPFLFGVLCGHFFWRLRANRDTEKLDK
jgi:hypothetical protein